MGKYTISLIIIILASSYSIPIASAQEYNIGVKVGTVYRWEVNSTVNGVELIAETRITITSVDSASITGIYTIEYIDGNFEAYNIRHETNLGPGYSETYNQTFFIDKSLYFNPINDGYLSYLRQLYGPDNFTDNWLSYTYTASSVRDVRTECCLVSIEYVNEETTYAKDSGILLYSYSYYLLDMMIGDSTYESRIIYKIKGAEYYKTIEKLKLTAISILLALLIILATRLYRRYKNKYERM